MECEIKFNGNSDRTFYAGEDLVGVVVLSLSERKTVLGVFCDFEGLGHCGWGNGKVKDEIYLEERTTFAGNQELDFGVHKYTFQLTLPPGLPSSFQEEKGNITYRIKVVLEPISGSKKEFTETFTVIRPLDLNSNPALKLPAEETQECDVGACGCLGSTAVDLTVRTSRAGYVPGETINAAITINNQSTTDLDNIRVKLVKFVHYGTDASQHDDKKTICKQTVGKISAQSNETFHTDISLPVDLMPADETSKFCQILYRLVVKASTGWCWKAARVELPLVIGTHPLEDWD